MYRLVVLEKAISFAMEEIQLLGSNSSEKQQVRPPHARDCVFLNRSTCWYKGFTPSLLDP